MTPFETTQKVVESFNAALKDDHDAIESLLEYRIPGKFPDDNPSTLIVEETWPGRLTIGALGLVNGALIAAGLPRVVANYEQDAGGQLTRLLDFGVYKPDIESDDDAE